MSAYVQTVVGSDSPPVGAVMDFAGNVEPSGWLFCFGQSLPRTGIYAQLFSVIGTLYGSVDGSSFSLPDFRGRVGAGKDNMGGTAASRLTTAWGVDGVTLGANGGAQSHQLTIAQMPSHTHDYMYALGAVAVGVASGSNFNQATRTSVATGGDGAHPNIQPTFVVNKIIKYTVSGTVLPIVPGEGDVVGPNGGVADGDLAVFNGTSGKIIRRGSLFSANFLNGLTIANNATDLVNDVNVAAGSCRSDNNTYDIVLASLMTKRLDAVWAAGTNQGGRDTATAVADNSYHVFVIANTSSGAVDVLLSPSISAPVMPSGFNVKRRVGSVRWLTNALIRFVQVGDYFLFAPSPPLDCNDGQPFSGQTFSIGTSCPLGMRALGHFQARCYSAGGAGEWTFKASDQTAGISTTTIGSASANVAGDGTVIVLTDISGNISCTFNNGVAPAHVHMNALGYWDRRGMDGYYYG